MKKFFDSQFWLVIVSVVFSLLLFLIATSNRYARLGSQISGATETYSHTLENVPIDIKYDSDKYFVSGYSYETEIYLTSVNRVKLDSEINSDTRNFKVVADLTNLGEGTKTVPLKIINLPSGVSAKTSTKNISVTIGKKRTKVFKVKGEVATKQLAFGYDLKKVSTNISEVEVTSSESIINQIDHVVAKLPEKEVLNGNYNGNVALQAVASDGTILASAINPSKAKLEVTVKKMTKTVPVTIKTEGHMDDQVSDISYKLSQSQVVISGSQEALDAVNEVIANVDVSNITKDTTFNVNLSANGVTIDPSVVSVQLTVTKK